MAKYIIMCLGVIAAFNSVKGLTKEELAKIEAGMLEHFQECNKQFGVSDEDIKAAKEHDNIAAIDPCLIGCVFKRAHFINDKGLVDADKLTELSKDYLKDEEDLAKTSDIIRECAKVNDEKVSDEAEGCERSKMLLACFTKHKGALMPVRRR